MNFIEENKLDEQYIKFAQKVLEKNDNDIFLELKNKENLTANEIEEKSNKIKEIIAKMKKTSDIKSQIFLSEEDYNTLRELAISKGGFLNMKFRREIYKIFLFFKEDDLSEKFLNQKKSKSNKISNNKNYIPSLKYYKNIWIDKNTTNLYWKNEYIYQELLYSKDRSIIKADTERCDINSTFPSENYPYINSLLKKRFEAGLNTLVNFNNCEFKYFQGYHDIFILFFYLYLDSPYLYISLFQRFSELYIKENLLLQNKSNLGYSFSNSMKFCMEIIKEMNEFVYNDIVEFCNSECLFIIPYIVSLFIHNMDNLNKKYRIFDYFMVSNPIAIYVMSCVIVVDELTKLKAEYNMKKLKSTALNFFGSGEKEKVPPLTMTDFFRRFQILDLDKANFDEYIQKTENEMKRINLEKIRNEFLGKKYQYEKYYPTIYSGKYLKDLIECDDENQKKIINNDIMDKSDDQIFNFLLKIYQRFYGGKKSSINTALKQNNFTNIFFVGFSFITLLFAYLIFTKII